MGSGSSTGKRYSACTSVTKERSLYEKLHILADAAKYDVACTSSGVTRRGNGQGMGNCTGRTMISREHPLPPRSSAA